MIKKKYILLLVLQICAVVSLHADKFKIESITHEPMDLSARTYEKKDFNDDICAIIKVRTDVEDIIFEATPSITLTEYKNKTREYWVYVSPGTKRFTISKKGFLTLDYIFPNSVVIESHEVYKLVLSKILDYKEVNTTDKGYFKVITSPPGAKILMDGNPSFAEISPYDGSIKKQLWPIGKRKFTISLDEYHDRDTVILIEKDKTTNLILTLAPSNSFLKFNINVENAELYINGKIIKDIEKPIRFSKGKLQLEVKANHYYSFKKEINVSEDGGIENIDIALKPISGFLTFLSGNESAKDADVYINDNKIGKVPLQNYVLQEGSYKLQVQKENFVKITKQIEIKENIETKFEESLTNFIDVTVISDPLDANFLINGNITGTTPLKTKLPIGTTSIVLNKPHFYDTKESFLLTEGTTTLTFKLTPHLYWANVGMYSSFSVVSLGFVLAAYETYNIWSKSAKYDASTNTAAATQLHKDISSGYFILTSSIGAALIAYVPYKFFKNKRKKSKSQNKNFSFIPQKSGVLMAMQINF